VYSEAEMCMEFLCMCKYIYIYIYIYIYGGPNLCICTIGDVSIIYKNLNLCDDQMMYMYIPYKYKNTYVVKHVNMCEYS
jgi:hypothetical protein